MSKISIVIPVYMNEGELHNTYSELLRELTNDLPEYDYEHAKKRGARMYAEVVGVN